MSDPLLDPTQQRGFALGLKTGFRIGLVLGSAFWMALWLVGRFVF